MAGRRASGEGEGLSRRCSRSRSRRRDYPELVSLVRWKPAGESPSGAIMHTWYYYVGPWRRGFPIGNLKSET